MGVVTIRGDNIIIEPNCCERPGHNCFLTDVKVTESADFLGLILLAGALLETPDKQHQPEHLDLVALLR
jgi:hypothetical protein